MTEFFFSTSTSSLRPSEAQNESRNYSSLHLMRLLLSAECPDVNVTIAVKGLLRVRSTNVDTLQGVGVGGDSLMCGLVGGSVLAILVVRLRPESDAGGDVYEARFLAT